MNRPRVGRRGALIGVLALIAALLGVVPASADHGGSPSPELSVVSHLGAGDLGVFLENITDVVGNGVHVPALSKGSPC